MIIGINSIIFGLLALNLALESISKKQKNNYKYYMLFLSGIHIGMGIYSIVFYFL